MQWSKKMSKSDAQQETKGSLMPFRFTQENCPGNFLTWFREEFFHELEWKDNTNRKQQSEEADITLSVCIQGENLGQRKMKLTHAESRIKNHCAPSTHLSFDKVTKKYLQENDMTGKQIVFSKDLAGCFNLEIEDAEP